MDFRGISRQGGRIPSARIRLPSLQLPTFDNSVRAREAVRATAQRLELDKGYSPNKQATLINRFLSDNSNANLPLKIIKHSTWIDFARHGSTVVPTDDRIVHCAWLWMILECPDILRYEYDIFGRHSFSHQMPFVNDIFLKNTRGFTPEELESLTRKQIRFAYKFARTKMAIGSFVVQSKNDGTSLEFILSLPYYLAGGEVDGEAFTGEIIPYFDELLFLGTSVYGSRPILLMITSKVRSGEGGADCLRGSFISRGKSQITYSRNLVTFTLYDKWDLRQSYIVDITNLGEPNPESYEVDYRVLVRHLRTQED